MHPNPTAEVLVTLIIVFFVIWLFLFIDAHTIQALIKAQCHLFLAIHTVRHGLGDLMKALAHSEDHGQVCYVSPEIGKSKSNFQNTGNVFYVSHEFRNRKGKAYFAEGVCALLDSLSHCMYALLYFGAACGHCLLAPRWLLQSPLRSMQRNAVTEGVDGGDRLGNLVKELEKELKSNREEQQKLKAPIVQILSTLKDCL